MSFELSLAPIKGITEKTFRDAFTGNFPGFDKVYAPFISGVHPKKANLSKFSDVLPRDNSGVDTIPQVVSNDADELVAVCNVLGDYSYAVVNWNLGCPFAQLTEKQKGCGILPFPDKIRKILDNVMPRLKVRLSVKTRLGYYDCHELEPVLEIFNHYPIHQIILHARTGRQLYSGSADANRYRQYFLQSEIPVAYNGDIIHDVKFGHLRKLLPETNSWMIGRGALIDPFLPGRLKGIDFNDAEKRKILDKFHHQLFEGICTKRFPELKTLGQMKAFWHYLAGIFSDGRELFMQLKKIQDRQSYLNFVREMVQRPFADYQEIETYWKTAFISTEHRYEK